MSVLLRYRKLGHTTTLRVDSPELEHLAQDLHSSALEDCVACSPGSPADLTWTHGAQGRWQIRLREQPWQQGEMSADLLYLQSDSLLDDFIRERLPRVPILHAGAVVAPNGVAVSICGASGAGKTSLVLACLLRQWAWLTDELLCFRQGDPLLAEGFRRNFNIKERSFPVFPQTSQIQGNREFELPDTRRRIRFLNPDRLGCGPFVESARIRAFVIPSYSIETGASSIKRISATDLVQHLAPELRTTHTSSIAWLAAITSSVAGFELQYRDPHEAVHRLEELTTQL